MTKLIKNYIEILSNNGIIITSTDTVPAIICNALSDVAVKKIYNIKQRDFTKPIAIFCANIAMAEQYLTINQANLCVLDQFAPGPITLILEPKSNSNISQNLNMHGNTIGLRVPKNEFLQELMLQSNMPLAATSANLSNKVMTLDEVANYFINQVDLIDLDGQLKTHDTSSIFDIKNSANIKELRPGPISIKNIKEILARNL
ncbi:MAG: threonylcarbamoyl-AMP synthase [Rickettsiales bacterium]|jgi:L-threonylcarbamoyladenylate synthase|nr:threonylcarbamoyl-AMP synthase [Rickettsiales bacterium]